MKKTTITILACILFAVYVSACAAAGGGPPSVAVGGGCTGDFCGKTYPQAAAGMGFLEDNSTSGNIMKRSTGTIENAVAGTDYVAPTGTANIATTGTISGKMPMITKTDDYTLGTTSAQEAYGYIVWISGANKIVTLPAVAAGMSVCVYSTDATAKVVDPNASDGIKNGTADRNADGHKITSGGTAGDFVCLVADSADGWTVLGKSGTWSDE